MVWQGLEAVLDECRRGRIDLAARQAVDDTRLAVPAEQEVLELAPRIVLLDHAVADVRAIEAGDERLGRLETEPFDDFAPGRRIGGRGQGDPRHLRKALVQDRQLPVFGAEIVTPLRHAMRFVDREQADLGLFEQVEKAPGQQAFGGDIEHLEIAAEQALLDLALGHRVEARIEEGRLDAELVQGLDLVLHQRDQRRNDDRRAGSQQGRDLVAKRLAATGRHQHEGIAATADAFDHGLLVAAERGIAKNAVEQLQCGIGHAVHAISCRQTSWVRCSVVRCECASCPPAVPPSTGYRSPPDQVRGD